MLIIICEIFMFVQYSCYWFTYVTGQLNCLRLTVYFHWFDNLCGTMDKLHVVSKMNQIHPMTIEWLEIIKQFVTHIRNPAIIMFERNKFFINYSYLSIGWFLLLKERTWTGLLFDHNSLFYLFNDLFLRLKKGFNLQSIIVPHLCKTSR